MISQNFRKTIDWRLSEGLIIWMVQLESRERKVNDSKNKIDEIENRIILLGDFFRLYMFLDAVTMPHSDIIEKLEFNIRYLRDFIRENGIDSLFPFK
ncbi:Uncharacterised protein [Pasteurella multocida]|nr:Uncharacterised protein [Pasteurella multocida]